MNVEPDFVRRWLSRESDAELFALYSFCKYLDDFPFYFDQPHTYYLFLFPIRDFAILLCEEMASRYFKKCVFEEVF